MPIAERLRLHLFLTASLLASAGLGSMGCTGDIGPVDGTPDPLVPPPTGTGGTTVSACVPGPPSVGVAPLRRLTRSQYNNTIRDLLGIATNPAATFSQDEKVGPFFSNATAPISELGAEQYLNAAEALADTAATTKLATLAPCDAAGDQAACGAKFVDTFGLRAFRRPLVADERARMVTLFESGRTTDGYAEGVRRVIQAMLQSPQFLYQAELGEKPAGGQDVIPLDGYLLASRLSFYLWDSTPDTELLRAAGAGELTTPAALRAQATRLITDQRAAASIASFHRQWLGMDQLPSLEKDTAVYKAYTPALRDAMAAETDRFTDYVVRSGDGKLETLLTAPFSFITDKSLADLYGVTMPSDPTKPVNMNPGQRAGLLTQASVLATQSHAEQGSPIRRGKMVREQLFCQTLSPPPPGADLTPPKLNPNLSTRDRFDMHRTQKECAACHALIDPIGYGFENYDGIGGFMATEAGKAVDATGTLTGTDVDGNFNGVLELSQKLSHSELVRSCVAEKWFNFGLGRTIGAAEACSMAGVMNVFKKSNNIRELLVELVATDAFRYGRFEKGAP